MKLYFAGDHAGFEMKGQLMEFIRSLGHDVEDLGPLEPKAGDDYPDYVIPLAKKVAGRPSTEERGIVVAGSGQGEIIAMNRVKGARAALLAPGPQMLPLIQASRDHNDSNILAIGARFCTLDEAKEGIRVWLKTPFSGDERHVRRLNKIEQMTDNLSLNN
jgi:ribose 5-phosphate isomerase B